MLSDGLKECFGKGEHRTGPGHQRNFVLTRQLIFKGQLRSETCRMTYGSNSAIADIGPLLRIRQQSAGYLPLDQSLR